MIKKLAAIGVLAFLLVMAVTTPWHGAKAANEDGIQVFDHNLYFGMRNNAEVSNLQEFLTDQGFYAGPVSGNYYLLTFQSVRKFQSAHGILDSGFFGPKTRAASNDILKKLIGEICVDESCSGDTLPAPQLTITTNSNLHATVGTAFAAQFTVEGGQGNYSITGSGDVPGLGFTGTYCPPAADGSARFCAQVINPSTITLAGTPTKAGTYTVTVVATEKGGVIYCITAPCPQNEKLLRYGKASFTIVVTDGSTSNGQAPVISGVKGPTTLAVNEEGVWSIQTNNPKNDALSYRVIWGDESTYVKNGAAAAPASGLYTQTATFAHRYQFPGSYKPTFYVANSAGLENHVSIGVTIGQGDTTSRVKVISPNGGEVFQMGETRTIRWSSYYGPTDGTTANMPSYVRSVKLSLLHPVQCFRAPCNDEEIVIENGVPDTGSYSWTIPSTLLAGAYRVQVTYLSSNCPPPPSCTRYEPCAMPACYEEASLSDASDNYFKVVGTSSVNTSISISSISPSTGPVGTQVTLTGSGFTASGNTVHFDFGALMNISSDGTHLTFSVPGSLSAQCRYSNPPCMIADRIVTNGTYSVWVTNANGESNKVSFTVTGQGNATVNN